ncbi:bifunctional UDP-sugar hydrolase/5'-nucleotidase [Leuconostocaceae bacterium ESL0958]|nr:bifunctional UDP-sugar hydrolase/5'-nucleotidase [Leuconostocaceae bacterium ESL0958]
MNLDIFSTSDSHTFWWPEEIENPKKTAPYGLFRAASALAARAAAAEKEGGFVLKIDNGDFIQGPLLGHYLAKAAPNQAGLFQQVAQAMAYDVRILGNHEFNYGLDYLKAIFREDDSLVNANVVAEATGRPFIGQPYKIFEKKGRRVAVIGLTTKAVPRFEQPENIRGLRFEDPVTVAAKLIQELRPTVDAIVIAYHGGFSRDLTTNAVLEAETGENQGQELLQLEGLTALVTGHQHRKIASVYQGVPVSQPGYRAEAVGHLQIALDEAGKGAIQSTAKAELIDTQDWPADASLVQTYQPFKQALDSWLDQVIAHSNGDYRITSVTAARRRGHPFLNLINNIQLLATGADLSATALLNEEATGFGQTITRRSILSNYPFPNTLVTLAMTGRQIKQALETNADYFTVRHGQLAINPAYRVPKRQDYLYDLWGGLHYSFDLNKARNQRVSIRAVQGQPFHLNQTYRVVVNNYRATGTGNPIFAAAQVLAVSQKTVAEIIADYCQEQSLLAYSAQPNFHIDY